MAMLAVASSRRKLTVRDGAATSLTSRPGRLALPRDLIDIASRRVVGYTMADHLRTEPIAGGLSNAVAAVTPGRARDLSLRLRLLVHQDRLRRPRREERGHALSGRTGQS
jgi:hypothetical protein